MNKRKIYAIYSRKSKFTGKGESIENQIEICRQYINLNFHEVQEDDILIYEDEGFSGGNLHRPQFKKMMSDAKDHKFDVIVCYRLDRISRNIGDFANLVKNLEDLHITFESVKEKFDTSNSLGRAMMYISSVFSQLERETIAERIKDNMYELAKSGRWLGGNTPTGFISIADETITIDGKKRKACYLKDFNDEIQIIKLIFNKFIEYNSMAKVERYFLENKIKTKNNIDFTRSSIKHILQNPVYMIADQDALKFFKNSNVDIYPEGVEFDGKHGVLAYNKTNQKPGKSSESKNISEWIISVGKHHGAISGHDWVKVQEILNQNKGKLYGKTYRKVRSNVALLSGLLFCGDCGDYMRPKMSQRYDKDGEIIYDYLCQTKERTKSCNCKMKRPKGNVLDSFVCEEIKKLSGDDSEFIKQLESTKKLIINHEEEFSNKLDLLKKEYSDNEKSISTLVMSIAKVENTPAISYITDQINVLHEKNLIIRQNINELENLINQNDFTDTEFDILRDLIISFGKSFDTMSVVEKRNALKVFVKKIVWDGKKAHIYLFGSTGDISLPDIQKTIVM